ncbi:phosphate ABC transporter substrate-binding protein PstS family protein [Desulfallas sp. Bu1-1]|uniref:phosphate ABC transporter substrate-binding protein PstS family protein n=1 Tax=Desulfallas sp. Bu1-1 TaxID=2787620 RepID=UPI00189E0114|nr:phosphate ABC transporter substrate-binding protein PstS family protein [Desulfallas sp. Bu1-1]MBF7083173.1 phosphate ABC transporter substrate-binding protein PstS family protein [Desulfallas sp. Bu1-1]
MRSKIFLALFLIGALMMAVSGCGGKTEKQGEQPRAREQQSGGANGSITAVGSSALQPLVEEAASQFMAKNPGAQIVVQGGGSGTGLSQVSQGAADIGNSDVFAEEKLGAEEVAQLVDHKVCVVGMAAVVNPDITVDNVTQQQLIDIFTGKITNWKDLGGPDVKIQLVNRPKSSGTRATFKTYALKGAEEARGIEQDSSGTVRKIINETPGAIGYLALSYLDGSVKPLKLDGVEPTKENIIEGKYPVWAYEHMYTKGEPAGLAKDFLDYMLSDEVQKTLVPELGYIPVTEMKVERDVRGNVTKK